MLLALVLSVPPAAAQAPGLVGYWKLDGDIIDSSGNAFNGTLLFRFSPYAAFQPGKLGLAIDSTAGAYGEVADNPQLSALGAAVTIEAWIYLNAYPPPPPPAQGGAVPIVGKWGPAGTSDDEYTLVVLPDRKLYAFMSGWGGYFELRSTMELPLQTWIHVAMVLDAAASQARLFVNGQLDNVIPTSVVADRDTALPLQIGYGKHEDSGPRTFPGLIDEVRVWKRALTADEIRAGMQPCSGDNAMSFAGICWTKRHQVTGTPSDPGSIFWRADNAQVEQGRLRLQVTREAGQWYGAEVYSQQNMGYGKYTFEVESPLNFSNPNLVLGMFVYTDADRNSINAETKCAPKEIDFEFTRWGIIPNWLWTLLGKPAWRQLTVAPNCGWPREAKLFLPLRYRNAGATRTIHTFTWTPDYVHFVSEKPDDRTEKLDICMAPWDKRAMCPSSAFHLAVSRVPVPDQAHRAHMNMWIYNSNAAPDTDLVPVFIKYFRYDPR